MSKKNTQDDWDEKEGRGESGKKNEAGQKKIIDHDDEERQDKVEQEGVIIRKK